MKTALTWVAGAALVGTVVCHFVAPQYQEWCAGITVVIAVLGSVI